MPFDKQAGSVAMGQLALPRDISRTYVPMSGSPGDFRVLDTRRRGVLAAWVDTLIPEDATWPSPSSRSVPQFIDNSVANSAVGRQALIASIDDADHRAATEFGRGLAECTPAERAEILKQIERDRGAQFSM